jgi:hypothetical protein
MLRLDSGPGAGRGDFCCSVPGCGWAQHGVSRQAARDHMQRHHPGMARGIARTPEAQEARDACRRRQRLPDEEKKEKHRVRCRRYRQEMKVRNSTPRHAITQAAPLMDARMRHSILIP